jgi:TatD DNase family protein
VSTESSSADGFVPLIDSHAHLEGPRLLPGLAGVLDRARQAGVVQVVAMGTTAESSAETVRIAQAHRGVFAAVGIHPNDAASAAQDDWARVLTMAGQARVVAIGETGLDRYRNRTPFPLQQEYFARHLALALANDLPVVIHCRECEGEIAAQLAALNRPVRGVLHSFSGTWDQARAFLDLGLAISFAGQITFANKALDVLRDAAARIPIDRLLVETDSPYLSPHPHRGQTNEPARVRLTALRLAEIRGLSFPELARATTTNAQRLFRLPKSETL